MKDFNGFDFTQKCREKKVFGAVTFDGLVIETDEENPTAVAYIPGMVDGIVPAPGYRLRVRMSADYWNAPRYAEIMGLTELVFSESSCQEDSSSTS